MQLAYPSNYDEGSASGIQLMSAVFASLIHTFAHYIMALEIWEKEAKEHQKAYKYMLEKSNKTKSVQNKLLNALPELHEEAFSKINCLDCARCCKNHSPRFKQPDIKRIAKSLGIKEGDLVANYLRLDEEGDYITRTQPCPFLAEDNSCNIYEDRPSDCRRYPYTDEDVLLKRVQLTLKNATVCPATHAVLEKLLLLAPTNTAK